MKEPRRIWWARPRKLCALERPGGGGRSHRPDRRAQEIEWLKAAGVRTVVSTMTSRHNLAAYVDAGLRWVHIPVKDTAGGEEALEEVLRALRRELRRAGAVAVHGNRHTDFVAAACAACLYDVYGLPVEEALDRAAGAGLTVSPEARALVGAR
jgi:MoaA/NifB/PqqE/SkfB family radical SAM enzyme